MSRTKEDWWKVLINLVGFGIVIGNERISSTWNDSQLREPTKNESLYITTTKGIFRGLQQVKVISDFTKGEIKFKIDEILKHNKSNCVL